MCLSKTHYASDKKFHKSMKDGEPACPKVDVCKKILSRIRSQGDLDEKQKKTAVARVEEYWEKRKKRASSRSSSDDEA